MPEARSQPASRLSLVGFLAAALFVELWLNRIAARLLRLEPGKALLPAVRRLDTLAFFFFELASVLGVLLLMGALARVIGSRRERPPLRFALALVGGVAVLLSLLGVFVRLPARLGAHLYLSAVFLLGVLVLWALSVPASRRLRAGIALVALPLGLMLVANLFQRLSAPGVLDPRASTLADSAGALLVLVGLLAPWLFSPPGPVGPLAFGFGVAVLGGGLAVRTLDPELCMRLASMGLGVVIPVGSAAVPIYLLGASGFAYAIGALLWRPGPERLAGIGLFLVCVVGLALELPYQIAGSLIGMICLIESGRRPALGAISREELDALLRRLAQLVGSGQAVIVGAPGAESARIAFTTAVGQPAALRLDRQAGAISEVELSVGEIPERAPPFSLQARGQRGLGPAAAGPVIATGEPGFDDRYVVRDHRGAGTALLDEPTRARIAQLIDGWIGVWPQRGVRYRGRALPPGDDGVAALTALLSDLQGRART